MKIQQFDGGLATRQRPQFLQTNEAVVYKNIDSREGSLVPVKDKSATSISVNRYHTFYDAQQEWVGFNTITDFLEYQGRLYYTDRSSRPQKYDGTNTYNLGITPPAE